MLANDVITHNERENQNELLEDLVKVPLVQPFPSKNVKSELSHVHPQIGQLGFEELTLSDCPYSVMILPKKATPCDRIVYVRTGNSRSALVTYPSFEQGCLDVKGVGGMDETNRRNRIHGKNLQLPGIVTPYWRGYTPGIRRPVDIWGLAHFGLNGHFCWYFSGRDTSKSC